MKSSHRVVSLAMSTGPQGTGEPSRVMITQHVLLSVLSPSPAARESGSFGSYGSI